MTRPRAKRRYVTRNRWDRRNGIWRPRHLDVRGVDDSVTSPPPPPARVHHPVVAAPSHSCFRVVRCYRHHGNICIEDLGGFSEPVPAMTLMITEIGRARVLDREGKLYSDNLQPIEVRL